MEILVLDLITAIIVAIYSFFVGIISSMLGVGGGFINNPILQLLFGFDPKESSSTASFATIGLAIAASLAFYMQKPRPVHYKLGLVFACLTVPGALLGVTIRNMIDNEQLRIIFGLLLLPIAIRMVLFPKKKRKKEIDDFTPPLISELPQERLMMGLAFGFFGGFMAGMLGIGGGVIIVPILSSLIGLPIHVAVATSSFVMIFTSSAATALNIINDVSLIANGGDPFIQLGYGIILMVGMVIGSQIGARTVKKFGSENLQSLFGIVMGFPLLRMMQTSIENLSVEAGAAVLDPFLSIIITLVAWIIFSIVLLFIKYNLKIRKKIVSPVEDESN
ncbi:MAG: sulfite exporter TauE/SafE family protein [Candidatus Hermodarchaeota archaeon]